MRHRNRASCLIVAALAFVFLVSSGSAGATEAPADPRMAQVAATLDSFHAAASRADGKAYFSLFSPDAVFIGTDASERWTLDAFRAYALPLFAEGHGWTYVPRERHISFAQIPCGCVAWFDELLDNPKYGTSRGTGVLIAGANGWKIAQYALTFPIPNDMAANATGLIRTFEAKDGAAKK